MTRHRLLSLLLVICLGLSTVGFGIARGHAPAVGQMVICHGYGMTIVAMDADGNPTLAQGLCPDAATVFHAALSLEPPAVLPVKFSTLPVRWPELAQDVQPHPPTAGKARAPPV